MSSDAISETAAANAAPEVPATDDAAAGDAVVRIRGLEHSYGERRALRGVDITVSAGSVHAFLGPNGSGKSTLFKILTTIVAPQSGHAELLGTDLAKASREVRRRIGVVFQSPALDKKLSVRANLRHAGHLQGLSGPGLEARIDEILEAGNLADRRSEQVETLSGGLRRRVEIAKALLHDPDVLLLDEPSTGLDPGARRDFWDLLRTPRATERGPRTVLFTTHLMDEAENADRVTLLHEGLVVVEGTPLELRSSVSGEVLEIETTKLDEVRAYLEGLGVESLVGPSSLRVRQDGAHRLIGGLLETHGDDVIRIGVTRPSLEDVFLERTGHRFSDTEAES